jgi:hypothetical protein
MAGALAGAKGISSVYLAGAIVVALALLVASMLLPSGQAIAKQVVDGSTSSTAHTIG